MIMRVRVCVRILHVYQLQGRVALYAAYLASDNQDIDIVGVTLPGQDTGRATSV
jgi:hypothetical protein